MSGTPTPSSSSSRSLRRYSIVLAANASSWTASPARASSIAAATVSSVCSVPVATRSSRTYDARRRAPGPGRPPRSRPSPRGRRRRRSGMPAASRISGPEVGVAPADAGGGVDHGGRAGTRRSASALTRSMSRWSITAMSPGRSRLVRFLVRESTRATPTAPAAGARGLRERRKADASRHPVTPPVVPRAGLDGVRARRSPPRRRAVAQLLGVRPGGARLLVAGQHPGQLGDPRSSSSRARTPLLVTRPSSALTTSRCRSAYAATCGQVGHHDHLGVRARAASRAPTRARPGRRRRRRPRRTRTSAPGRPRRRDHLDGEHHPGQLTAGGRPWPPAAAACPRAAASRISTSSTPCAVTATGVRAVQLDDGRRILALGERHLEPGAAAWPAAASRGRSASRRAALRAQVQPPGERGQRARSSAARLAAARSGRRRRPARAARPARCAGPTASTSSDRVGRRTCRVERGRARPAAAATTASRAGSDSMLGG